MVAYQVEENQDHLWVRPKSTTFEDVIRSHKSLVRC